ncbi:hypothetical protein, partial [Roseburia sp. AF25-25LB]|uniref:hypothetical protein n=1 Tax=Roseburia sp. AF25-25LB TaxID=2293135 RepID=UPI000FF47FB2
SVCNNYGLTIKMISTNYAFPRIIKVSEEKALIWDQTESVCNNYGLTIKMISTNYAFPRIIKVSEEKALIWDQTYWELFSLYFSVFHRFKCYSKEDNCV